MSGQLLEGRDTSFPMPGFPLPPIWVAEEARKIQEVYTDMVEHPPHYNQFGIEVVDILEMYFPNNPHLWNAGKYLLRSGYKHNELEDIRKMIWYAERYLKFKEKNDADAVSETLSQQGNS